MNLDQMRVSVIQSSREFFKISHTEKPFIPVTTKVMDEEAMTYFKEQERDCV